MDRPWATLAVGRNGVSVLTFIWSHQRGQNGSLENHKYGTMQNSQALYHPSICYPYPLELVRVAVGAEAYPERASGDRQALYR